MSSFGRFTLYPCVLHDFMYTGRVISGFAETGLSQTLRFWPQAAVISVALTAALSSRLTRAVLGVFVEPTWLEKMLAEPTVVMTNTNRKSG